MSEEQLQIIEDTEEKNIDQKQNQLKKG